MRTIWKYGFDIKGNFDLAMPEGARIRDVRLQKGIPIMWAEVETENKNETRHFELYGTGHEIADYTFLRFIKTFHQGEFVWHLYER